jgi:hypothetical protein
VYVTGNLARALLQGRQHACTSSPSPTIRPSSPAPSTRCG